MHSLPIFVRLNDRPVILIAEGASGDAKRRLLTRAGAQIVNEDQPAALAIVGLDHPDETVARLKARGVLVNAVDRPDLCDFTLPAIVDRDPVLVAIGTGGVSAGLAAALRQRLEGRLSPKLGALARVLQKSRLRLRRLFPDPAERRKAIASALGFGGPLDLDDPDLDNPLWAYELGLDPVRTIIFFDLVSDDPDDLTLRQARLLGQADRVYHRPDVPSAILNRARADAERIACPAAPLDHGEGHSVDLTMVRP